MDFYINVLGFELEENQKDKYIWLKLGEQSVLLRPGNGSRRGDKYSDANTAFVIYTDDVNKTLAEFTGRGLAVKGDDSGCPVFTDTDGNWFQLVNPAEH